MELPNCLLDVYIARKYVHADRRTRTYEILQGTSSLGEPVHDQEFYMRTRTLLHCYEFSRVRIMQGTTSQAYQFWDFQNSLYRPKVQINCFLPSKAFCRQIQRNTLFYPVIFCPTHSFIFVATPLKAVHVNQTGSLFPSVYRNVSIATRTVGFIFWGFNDMLKEYLHTTSSHFAVTYYKTALKY